MPDLTSEFDIPNTISTVAGANGLAKVVVSTAIATAEIYLNGACVTHYQRHGEAPLLFLSKTSKYDAGKAIRGGVPLIFPWFGPHPTDSSKGQHGFARAAAWTVVGTKVLDDGSAQVVFGLTDTEQTRAQWPYSFALRYIVTVGERLTMELQTTNTGSEQFTFEDALHTYFEIGNIATVGVLGLEGTTYADKVDGGSRKLHESGPITISGETDRVFLNTGATCRITEPGAKDIAVEKSGSLCTVVWNPGEAKAEGLPDLAGNQWPHFVCVEAANSAEHAITLAPGATHSTTCTVYRD